MKRIHYGALELDVSDAYARALQAWVEELTSRVIRPYRTARGQEWAGGGRQSMFVTVPCVPSSADQAELVQVLVSPAIPLAFAPAPRTLPDPSGTTEATLELEQWYAEANPSR